MSGEREQVVKVLESVEDEVIDMLYTLTNLKTSLRKALEQLGTQAHDADCPICVPEILNASHEKA